MPTSTKAAPTLLTRDAILAAHDIATEDVAVPEWGGTVRVKGLTAKQRDEFDAAAITGKGKNRDLNMRNIRARLAAMTIVDEHGDPLFDMSDLFVLGEKSAGAIDRVFGVASRLSGIGDADLEELSGNSDGQSDGSRSV